MLTAVKQRHQVPLIRRKTKLQLIFFYARQLLQRQEIKVGTASHIYRRW